MTFRPLLAGCLFLAAALLAQDSNGPSRRAIAATQHRAIGIEVRSAKGRPFSARDRIEVTLARPDGTTQKQLVDGPVIARDGSGRIYRQMLSRVGVEYTVILDPVVHTRIDCEIAKRTCTITDYRVSASVKPPPDGTMDNEDTSLPRASLGSETMEGLEVTGEREGFDTRLDSVDRPQLTEMQFWYSRDLEINLLVTRKYSNGNESVIRVIDISRAEPDSRIFRALDGFVVQDQRGSPGN